MFSVANDYLSTHGLGTSECSWGVGVTRYVLIKTSTAVAVNINEQCSCEQRACRKIDCVSSQRLL